MQLLSHTQTNRLTDRRTDGRTDAELLEQHRYGHAIKTEVIGL